MPFYRALLHAYPKSFRAEYGEEMCRIFARRMRNTSAIVAAFIWIQTFLEVLWNAAAVHCDILGQDVRFISRSLRRSPGFAVTVIVVAALGIGATTASFTLLDHVLIRPLPFADQDRLVKLYENHSFAGRGGEFWDMAPANYRDWKTMSKSFQAVGAFRGLSLNLVGQGDPQRIEGTATTADVFPMLGVKPILGRLFTDADDRESAPGTVIFGYGFWQRQFGGDASVLGRTIILDDHPYTVIGVMPPGFYFPGRQSSYWTPMRFAPRDFEDRGNTFIYSAAKLKQGVSLDQARAELQLIAGQLERAYPKELAHIGATVIYMREDISSQSKLALSMLLGAALCVLLVACMNIASLLLTRAMVRKKELAVRAAMGAGRERLVRQMLTESLMLAGLGGALGVFIAKATLPLLARLVPVSLPIAQVPTIDPRVLLFALFVTLATGIGFGVAPALRVSRSDDALSLRETSRAGGGRRERLRSLLVVTEITGSLVLLVSCGLLIRAMWRVQAVDPGFQPDNVLTMRTSLPMPKYEKLAPREQFYRRVLEQAKQLPGVIGAAYTSFLPIIHRGGVWPVQVDGSPQDPGTLQNASARFVTPGFFSVMGIPLLQGRDVADSDKQDTLAVALVSKSFVDHYWPGVNPIGRRFRFGNMDRVVAGMVGDVRVRGLERSSEPQVYMPYPQLGNMSTWYAPKDLAIRATGNVAGLAPALIRIIHQADAEQPVSDVRMFSDVMEQETAPRRMVVTALGAFALIAFLLAAIGIHGLLSSVVGSRTQEIGVRMALGATPGNIVGMILRDGCALALAGIALGTGLAYVAGKELESLLAGLRPTDVATFGAAIGLCLLMTVIGSLFPAVRALRIDPTKAIRIE